MTLEQAISCAISHTKLDDFEGFEDKDVHFAISILAPVLVTFCLWIICEARSRNVKKLFFISRDGEILLDICKILLKKNGSVSPHLRYLYGSRQAWSFPKDEVEFDFRISDLLHREKYINTDQLLDKLLPKNESREPWLELLADVKSNNEHKSYSYLEKVQKLRTVFHRSEGKKLIQDSCKVRNDLFKRFLKQEGVFGKEKIGFVDLGWHGSSLSNVLSLMKSKKKDSPETFFFGLKSNRFPPSANHPQTFLFDRELSTGFEPKDIPLSAMLEIFCYAVHGRVLGYKTYSSKIVPIFDKKLSDKNALKTVEISRKACTQLAINWPNDKASHSITKEDARKVIKRIKPIFRSASKIAKNRWMNFPFDFDSDGSDVSTIAKRFTQQSKSKITLQSGKNKKHFFNHLGLKRKDKVIIFGAGEAGFEVYNRIHKKVSVIAFCDNNRKKIGITDKGIPVVYSKTIPSLSFTFIIVASVYAFEIHSQLIKEINVDFSKILISPIF